MKIKFSCSFCGLENKREFNLRVNQKDFIIEVVKTKCLECKKFNFVTPIEVKNALKRRSKLN